MPRTDYTFCLHRILHLEYRSDIFATHYNVVYTHAARWLTHQSEPPTPLTVLLEWEAIALEVEAIVKLPPKLLGTGSSLSLHCSSHYPATATATVFVGTRSQIKLGNYACCS